MMFLIGIIAPVSSVFPADPADESDAPIPINISATAPAPNTTAEPIAIHKIQPLFSSLLVEFLVATSVIPIATNERINPITHTVIASL